MSTKTKNTDITSEEEALHFVSLYDNELRKVPVEFMTKKVCDTAFKQKPYSSTYAYIPERHRTFAMFLQAAPDYGSDLKDFANCHIQDEWGISVSAFVALKKKGTLPNLKKVTDPEIIALCYKRAYSEDPTVLKHMPKDVISKVLNATNVRRAISCSQDLGRFSSTRYFKGDELISLIPNSLMTKENIEYLQETIKEELTSRKSSVNVSAIPQEYMTDELYELAVEKSAYNLSSIPENRITKKMCEIAVKINGSVIKDVPEDWRDSLYVDVVKSGKGLNGIPEADRTDRLCTLAVESNPSQYQYVPQDKKSYAISLQAIDNNAEMMEFVPTEIVDKEMIVRFIISIFRKNWEHDYSLIDSHRSRRDRGEQPTMKVVFDNYFEDKEGSYSRKQELRELMHEVISRDAKLYFQLLDFSGENDKNEGFHRFNSEGWKNYFQGSVEFEHAVTAAKTDIEVVSGFKQDVQARVWKEYLLNNK